jgi:hypothetical protein
MKTLTNDSNRAVRVRLVAPLIILILLLGAAVGIAYWAIIQVAVSPIFRGGTTMAGNVLTHNLSEPLNGAKSATVDIDAGDGNLTIDRLASGEPVLASGTLQYLEKQGLPSRSLNISNGQADLTLRGEEGGQPWFRFPWSACNGATEWQIHLNPNVQFAKFDSNTFQSADYDHAAIKIEITANSGAGNVSISTK